MPAWAKRHAQASPITPAPIDRDVEAAALGGPARPSTCLRRNYPDQVLRSAAELRSSRKPPSQPGHARLPSAAPPSYPVVPARIRGHGHRRPATRATGPGAPVLRDRLAHPNPPFYGRPSKAARTCSSCATPRSAKTSCARGGGVPRPCDDHDALFWINDRPDLALRAGADGVHVGQDDMNVEGAGQVAGGELLIGLSTHSPDQLERGSPRVPTS